MDNYINDGMTEQEANAQVGGQTVVPYKTVKMPNLGGKSMRRLLRQNTVHLRAICPSCGFEGLRFTKRLVIKGDGLIVNRWVCPRCGKKSKREELKYVKYV